MSCPGHTGPLPPHINDHATATKSPRSDDPELPLNLPSKVPEFI
jgi:hypothetical protein